MITVMTTRDSNGVRPLLTKRFTPAADGGYVKHDYDSATYYDAVEADPADIHELSEILTMLERDPHSCIVRGETINGDVNIRRRLRSEPGKPATLRERPGGLQWVMMDFDKVPVGGLNLQTIDERREYLISLLPAEFQDVTYHYQWSSSAGTSGWDFLSMHAWFWLDQPWRCRTLFERIFEGDWSNCEVDSAPFTANQPHYTASPIFQDCVDPIQGQRSGLILCDRDEVTVTPWSKPIIPTPIFTPKQHYQTFGLKRFEEMLGEIGPHYHRPILRAVAHYMAVVPIIQQDRGYLIQAITDAVWAGVPGRSSKFDYVSLSYLNRVIDGAAAKFGGAL